MTKEELSLAGKKVMKLEHQRGKIYFQLCSIEEKKNKCKKDKFSRWMCLKLDLSQTQVLFQIIKRKTK
jgi:hypothetical protein